MKSDQAIWNSLFAKVPQEWKTAEPTQDMEDCAAFLASHQVKTVLDVGCAVGIWAVYLSKLGFRVKGFDFAANAIAFARQWTAEEGLDIEFACDSVTARPFGNVRFGAVVAAKILDNVERDQAETAIRHIHDSIRDNGVLFALFNPHLSCEAIEKHMAGDNPTKGITQINYTDEALKGLFPQFDLLEMKIYEHGFRGLFLRKVSNNLLQHQHFPGRDHPLCTELVKIDS